MLIKQNLMSEIMLEKNWRMFLIPKKIFSFIALMVFKCEKNALYHFFFDLTVSIKSFGTLCRAAMLRTAFASIGNLEACLNDTADGGGLDAAFVHPFAGWRGPCAAVSLQNACNNFDA